MEFRSTLTSSSLLPAIRLVLDNVSTQLLRLWPNNFLSALLSRVSVVDNSYHPQNSPRNSKWSSQELDPRGRTTSKWPHTKNSTTFLPFYLLTIGCGQDCIYNHDFLLWSPQSKMNRWCDSQQSLFSDFATPAICEWFAVSSLSSSWESRQDFHHSMKMWLWHPTSPIVTPHPPLLMLWSWHCQYCHPF